MNSVAKGTIRLIKMRCYPIHKHLNLNLKPAKQDVRIYILKRTVPQVYAFFIFCILVDTPACNLLYWSELSQLTNLTAHNKALPLAK